MTKKKMPGGAYWYLPGRKRPFMNTTLGTAHLLHALAEEHRSWAEIRDEINYDPDAVAVCERFIKAGHGDDTALGWFVNNCSYGRDYGAVDFARDRFPYDYLSGVDDIVGFTPRGFAELLAGRLPEWVPVSERTIRMSINDLAALLTGTLEEQATVKTSVTVETRANKRGAEFQEPFTRRTLVEPGAGS